MRAEAAGPAELPLRSAPCRVQYVSDAAEGCRIHDAERSLPPGEQQAGKYHLHEHTATPLTYFCGLLLLGESWCRKLLGGAAGVEVRPLPVLWNSGIWSPLSAGCYLSALCGKCSQLEGVHICSGQQINMNRSFELFLSVHQLELEASRWCEGDSSYCKRGEKN